MFCSKYESLMMILTITVVGEQPDIVEDMSALCLEFERFEGFEV
jgi:hypothetical protein